LDAQLMAATRAWFELDQRERNLASPRPDNPHVTLRRHATRIRGSTNVAALLHHRDDITPDFNRLRGFPKHQRLVDLRDLLPFELRANFAGKSAISHDKNHA